ncbi:MAG: heparan-alpha-glucosaminide N-acetyltransferase domain-containing protein [Steroidobacteraceae bacterium]
MATAAETMVSGSRSASGAAAGAVAATRSRIASIDVMRGLVMLFMLVDHVREAIYLHKQVGDPMDLATTEPALFFTRLCAHLCAPTFVFLTGLGAWLYAHPANGATRSAREFLVKRGLLLILLELTVINFAWAGDMPPKTLWLQVIWAIGISMVVLGLMSGLPRALLAAVGAIIVFGHNLASAFHLPPEHPLWGLWTILHERAFLVPEGALKVKVTYPVLPWIGVILLGWVAGPLYAAWIDSPRRRRLLVALGLGCLALLALLRGFNIYGETLPWAVQADGVHTTMSFINFTKYPPSLDFLLLTIGLALLLMAAFEARDNRATRAIATFGGAPMFFYILHLYLLLILQKLAVATLGANHGERWGVDSVHWIWVGAAVLAFALYFPTRAFAQYKRRTTRAWVRYF